MNKTIVPISVVIPARNEETNISNVLVALLHQHVLPKEVIVVNNASTDRTQQILVPYIKIFKIQNVALKILHEPRVGVARTKNTGYTKAINRIIASTDADCIPSPDWIARIYHHFQHHDSIAVTGSIIMTDAPTGIKIATQLGWYRLLHYLGKKLLGVASIHTGNAAIQKEYFEQCGRFNEKIINPEDNDDFEISSRLMTLGPIRFDPSICVSSSFRRYATSSQTIRVSLHRLRAWYSVAQKTKMDLS